MLFCAIVCSNRHFFFIKCKNRLWAFIWNINNICNNIRDVAIRVFSFCDVNAKESFWKFFIFHLHLNYDVIYVITNIIFISNKSLLFVLLFNEKFLSIWPRDGVQEQNNKKSLNVSIAPPSDEINLIWFATDYFSNK